MIVQGEMLAVPPMLSAPGPGRPTARSTSGLPELGRRAGAASAVLKVPMPAGVSACPISVMVCALASPKAPAAVWLGQNAPLGATLVAVALAVAARPTGST